MLIYSDIQLIKHPVFSSVLFLDIFFATSFGRELSSKLRSRTVAPTTGLWDTAERGPLRWMTCLTGLKLQGAED